MKEIQLGAHTFQSHGIKLAKAHLHDWLILVLLLVIVIILNLIHPFYRFVGKDMMDDLKYPWKSNTVPVWAVPIIALLLPVVIFLAFYYRRRDVYDLHHAILGLLFSVLITAVITDAIKDAVGRPRPDFFWRCFPDGKELYDHVTGHVICHGLEGAVKEGHKSFPSGHTSWSFAGLSFLSLYLSGKIRAFDLRGHVAKLCIVFLPLLLASLVGVSRVDDYRHHWQDVFAGAVLGIVLAAFCYLQFFPAPHRSDGWGSYAYFQMLESQGESSKGECSQSGSGVILTAEVKMARLHVGVHTVKSHGFKVVKIHKHDWLILLLLVVIEVVLNVINPFFRFVGENMMTDLKYPLKDNTVPFWAVPVVAIILPFIIFIAIYFKRRDVYDLHHAILGLLFSVLITGVITDAIKDAVGRPRPDFFWRCFPDGKSAFDPVTGGVICHGVKSVIKEGHKSFPSGHTSWSFAGLGFLSWYLSGKIKAFDREGHIAKLCIVFFPLLVAAMVGISRVDDYWHHWQDVFAGGLLGLTVSSFCYLQFFPLPYGAEGWGPHAFFRSLAERERESENGPSLALAEPTVREGEGERDLQGGVEEAGKKPVVGDIEQGGGKL